MKTFKEHALIDVKRITDELHLNTKQYNTFEWLVLHELKNNYYASRGLSTKAIKELAYIAIDMSK